MDTQNLNRIWIVSLLLVSFTLVSCQETIPDRATITSKNNSVDKGPLVCPVGEVLEKGGTGADAVSKCVPGKVVRPSDAITFKPDFCACKDGKPISFGNCNTFCAGKGTGGAEQLYASFDTTAAISLNTSIGSVRGWCNNLLVAGDPNPKCEIEAKDSEQNVIRGQIISFPTNNSVIADIKNLSNDKTYVITLVESTSNARSKPAQIIKPSVETPISMLGPLKNAPISQYACIIRQFSTLEPDLFYEKAYRVHFYYLPSLPPNTVNASNIFCHDIIKEGPEDLDTHARFENIPGVFNLWDTTDPRFYDNDGNGILDIYDLIVQKTKNFGGSVSAATKFFIPFTWPGSPTLNEEAGNTASTTTTPIGYYMAPWIDQQNQFKSFCLTSANYNTTNPLFKSFRDVIGVDTEGLYVGEKAPESIFNTNGQVVATGVKDYILIRESDIKSIWFYMKNGVPTAPTDDNVANVAVFFYYPINKATPFIKSSSQRIYRVKGGKELSNGNTSGSQPTGAGTSYPPHDRKIGCIPKF